MPDPQAQASVVPESPLWKPTIRHPMALLKIVDDGNDEGETIRMRGDKVLIGRTEGDVVISHDITMAPRHASITRVPNGTWELTDLGSPEGTFLRVASATLRRGSTFLIGSTKLLFTPAADESDEVDALMEVRLFGAGERAAAGDRPLAAVHRGAARRGGPGRSGPRPQRRTGKMSGPVDIRA